MPRLLPLSLLLVLPSFAGCGSSGSSEDARKDTPAMLRANIGLDLGQVSSFLVLSGSSSAGQSLHQAFREVDSQTHALESNNGGPRLLALTLSGEVLEVSLVEPGSGGSQAGGFPGVQRIYPTASWILFATWGFRSSRALESGEYESIDCQTIAARRADGALFCAPLAIRDAGPQAVGTFGSTVHANAAGDLAYAAVNDANDPSQNLLYKISLAGADGPTASLVDPNLHPSWFFANATGDLLVNDFPQPLDTSTRRTRVQPLDGGPAFTLQGTQDLLATCGDAGAADEDAFYVFSATGGTPSGGTIAKVSRIGAAFAEEPLSFTLDQANTYFGLFRLADGIYTVSRNTKAIARVIVDGAVDPSPTPKLIEGADELIDIGGLVAAAGAGELVFLARSGTTYKFVRHDGVRQVDIPVDAGITLTRVSVASSGAIDFWGSRTDTQEKVRGSIPAGSTQVTVTSSEVTDPSQVVVFTRIN